METSRKSLDLTTEQQAMALSLGNAVSVAKLAVYELNVELEGLRTRVTTAVQNVKLAEAQFTAGVGMLAHSAGITNWRISQDFARIEESK